MVAVISMVVGVLFGVVAAVVMRAWVLTILWGWFLVPLGAVELSIPSALGIAMVISMFTAHLANDESNTVTYNGHNGKEVLLTASVKAFGQPLVTLLFAWIVTLFM